MPAIARLSRHAGFPVRASDARRRVRWLAAATTRALTLPRRRAWRGTATTLSTYRPLLELPACEQREAVRQVVVDEPSVKVATSNCTCYGTSVEASAACQALIMNQCQASQRCRARQNDHSAQPTQGMRAVAGAMS